MTREEFYLQACLTAMQGLLAASGDYRDEFIVDPPKHVAVAAEQYAEALTLQIYGEPIVWPSDIL